MRLNRLSIGQPINAYPPRGYSTQYVPLAYYKQNYNSNRNWNWNWNWNQRMQDWNGQKPGQQSALNRLKRGGQPAAPSPAV